MKSTATANWKGTGKEGKGTVSTRTGVLDNHNYSFHSRFEDGEGTSPEELIAAAHAGCISMKLSFILNAAGFTPDYIDTKCMVTIDKGVITESHLDIVAKVPGIDAKKFAECADEAKQTCPVSMVLNTNIILTARLE